MSTTDPDATAVLEVSAEPAPEPAPAPEVPEVQPGTEAEPHEPALDLAGLARLTARAAAVLAAPWPVMTAPVIFTPEARASVSEYDRSVEQAERAAHASHADAYRAGMDAVNGRLDDYLVMRAHYEPAAA